MIAFVIWLLYLFPLPRMILSQLWAFQQGSVYFSKIQNDPYNFFA